jgi:hypothetical protein
MKEGLISGLRALATRQPMTPYAIFKGSRGKRIVACSVPIRMAAMIGRAEGPLVAALVLPEFTMPRFRRVDSACVSLSHFTDQVINNSKYLFGGLAERGRSEGGSFEDWVILKISTIGAHPGCYLQ